MTKIHRSHAVPEGTFISYVPFAFLEQKRTRLDVLAEELYRTNAPELAQKRAHIEPKPELDRWVNEGGHTALESLDTATPHAAQFDARTLTHCETLTPETPIQ